MTTYLFNDRLKIPAGAKNFLFTVSIPHPSTSLIFNWYQVLFLRIQSSGA
jgi:hypothetical protein